jgi:hypothetical protein
MICSARSARFNRQMPAFLARLEEVLGSTQKSLVSIEARLANLEAQPNRPPLNLRCPSPAHSRCEQSTAGTRQERAVSVSTACGEQGDLRERNKAKTLVDRPIKKDVKWPNIRAARKGQRAPRIPARMSGLLTGMTCWGST